MIPLSDRRSSSAASGWTASSRPAGHKGLEDQQCDRHDDAENKEQEQYSRDQQLMLAQTDRGGTAALAADGGVGLARADQASG